MERKNLMRWEEIHEIHSISDLIAKLSEVLKEHPDAKISSIVDEYSSGVVKDIDYIDVVYKTLETDSEFAERLEYEAEIKAKQDEEEKKLYLRLKTKFENETN